MHTYVHATGELCITERGVFLTLAIGMLSLLSFQCDFFWILMTPNLKEHLRFHLFLIILLVSDRCRYNLIVN